MAEQTVKVNPYLPRIQDNLSGSVLDDSVIITIPVGRVWFGYLSLSATLVGASQTSSVTINTTPPGAVPDPAVSLIAVTLSTGTTSDAQVVVTSTPNIYVYGVAGGTGIDVSIDGGATAVCSAIGYLL
jgi:hypothetical protein